MEYKKKQKNRIFPKMVKKGKITCVDTINLCHDTLFIFFPIMECWTVMKESAKNWFKGDFRALIVRLF